VAVADVSGKGVPAALYMMVTKGLISAVARESGDLRHILQSINLHLHKACKRKVFVTMAAVAIDPAARRVEYGRAGHNPMVWRRARRGETLLMKPSGVGLGMCSADPFARSLRLEELEMEEGDAIVLYSDGVTEAVNLSMDQFGEDRLMRAIESADGMPATGIRAAIMRDLATFAEGAPARDDITVVAIRG
jgi:sigma-B regulation protein RsbU (phosphoserine phosphatase)